MTKNELKYYSSLLNKKQRREENKILVEGRKLITEAIGSGYECEILFVAKDSFEEDKDFSGLIQKRKIKIEFLKAAELSKLSDTKTNQGLIAVFRTAKLADHTSAKQNMIVALENVSDPGNMGTVIRNCDWFGVKEIILSGDCAEVFSPKVIRASAGSVFHVVAKEYKNFYDELALRKKAGYKIVCADLKGEDVYSFDLKDKIIVVFANEGNGPTPHMKQLTDMFVAIPRRGEAESLNVASASAVILSELTK
ncbi:MAG: RNA methyltransferase [Bacteroidota bacterium]